MAEMIKSEVVTFSPLSLSTSAPSVDLVGAFLSGRNAKTLRSYRGDLEDFAAFTGSPSIQAAASLLTSQGHGAANVLGLAYRVSLQERGLAPATINRRLASLKSLVKMGRLFGVISWSLEVEPIKSSAYRNTKGPGVAGFKAMLEQLEALEGLLDKKTVRDRSILRLLFSMALRRGEVVELDREHLDLEAGTLSILGKARTERESLTIPAKTLEALREWVFLRGDEAGPLFFSLDRAHYGHRLDGSSIYLLVRELGRAVGLEVRPHGLRHAGITQALDLTNGNTRAVQRFSRHKKLETLGLYDDNRADLGGQIAALVDLGA